MDISGSCEVKFKASATVKLKLAVMEVIQCLADGKKERGSKYLQDLRRLLLSKWIYDSLKINLQAGFLEWLR